MTSRPFCSLFGSFCLSQLPTLKSGPLAHSFPPYLRHFPQFLPRPVDHWRTKKRLGYNPSRFFILPMSFLATENGL